MKTPKTLTLSIALLWSCMLAWYAHSFGQEASTKIQVKQGGFIARERFLTITLSDARGNVVGLTDETLTVLSERYFLCRGAEDWDPGEEFFEKEMGKLTIQQQQTFSPETKTIGKDKKGTQCLIGYNKAVSFEFPIVFTFEIDGTRTSATLQVPEEYWEKYTWSKEHYDNGIQAQSTGRWKEAISSLFPLYKEPSLKKFSFHRKAMDALNLSYDMYILDPYKIALTDFKSAQSKDASDPIAAKVLYQSASKRFKQLVQAFEELEITEVTQAEQRSEIAEAFTSAGTYSAKLDSVLQGMDDRIEQWEINKDLEAVRWTHTATADQPKYTALLDALSLSLLDLEYSLPLEQVREAVAALRPSAGHGLDPGVRVTFDGLISQTRRLFKRKQWGFPQAFMENVQKNSFALPQPYFAIFESVALYLQGKPSEEAVDSAISMATNPTLLLGLGALREEIRATLSQVPASARTMLGKAKSAVKTKDYPTASALLDEALKLTPGYTHALIYYGSIQLQQGQTEYAERYFEEVVTRDPGNLLAYLKLESIYRDANDTLKITDLVKSALIDRRDLWWFQQRLGDLFFQQSNYRRAVQAYKYALELNPNSLESRHALFDTYLRLTNYTEAEQVLKEEKDPASKGKLAALKTVKRVTLPATPHRIFFQDLSVAEGQKKGWVVLKGQLINANARVPQQIDLIVSFYDVNGKELGKGIRSVSRPAPFQVTPLEIIAQAAYANVVQCNLEITLIQW